MMEANWANKSIVIIIRLIIVLNSVGIIFARNGVIYDNEFFFFFLNEIFTPTVPYKMSHHFRTLFWVQVAYSGIIKK